MASLLEKLRQKRTESTVNAPVTGQTEAAARLLQAKTGKAPTAPVTPISAEGERAVAQEVAGQQDQIQQGARIAAAGEQVAQEGMEQAANLQKANIQQESKAVDERRKQALADMNQQLAQEYEKIGLSKEEAALDARLFERRLSDSRYLTQLQQSAQENRLYDAVEFRRKMEEDAIGNRTADLLVSQEYQRVLAQEGRDWNEKMGNLSATQSYDLAIQKVKDEMEREKWQSGTDLLTTAIGIGAKKADTSSTEGDK